MTISIHHADCVEWLKNYSGPLFDSAVTDPPYHLTSIVKRFGGANAAEAKDRYGAFARQARGFMGKTWDGGDIAQRPETWRAVYDVLKPGAHLVAFAGTRTYHRMACAIEDAGFEIRDCLMWCYGSGFPKSHNVGKSIDRMAGATREVVGDSPFAARKPNGSAGVSSVGLSATAGCKVTAPATPESAQWDGWGTALKPALEPICLARKPLSEKSVAANVLRWGTGAINIDGCRVGTVDGDYQHPGNSGIEDKRGVYGKFANGNQSPPSPIGRWPANLIHDGSEEVLAGFPDTDSGGGPAIGAERTQQSTYGKPNANNSAPLGSNSGSAARFFYSAKAGPLDRIGSAHATIKPVDLMRWLCRLVTPPGGHILEPFAGSGTTGIAGMAEGFDVTMLELEADHVSDIERKLAYLRGEGRLSFVEHDRQRDVPKAADIGGLFGEAA